MSAPLEPQWEPVVLRKNTPKTVAPPKPAGNKEAAALLSDDPAVVAPPKKLGQTAGKQIEQARCTMKIGDKSMTRKQLAQRLNITENMIAAYEKGDLVPNTELLRRICNTVGLKVSDLKRD